MDLPLPLQYGSTNQSPISINDFSSKLYILVEMPCADPEGGGAGGPGHPEKSQKYRVS